MSSKNILKFSLFTAAACCLSLTSCTTTSGDADGETADAGGPRKLSEVQVAVLNTKFGRIVIELNDARTPMHARNFREVIVADKLDGTTFHRVLPGFIIQGGDPNSRDSDRENDGFGGPGHTVPYEGGLAVRRGSVVMARTPDAENPSRASNGSQFYIMLRDSPNLTGVDTVFGRVVIGMDVVEQIASQTTDDKNNPVEPVVMTAELMSFEKARRAPAYVAE